MDQEVALPAEHRGPNVLVVDDPVERLGGVTRFAAKTAGPLNAVLFLCWYITCRPISSCGTGFHWVRV